MDAERSLLNAVAAGDVPSFERLYRGLEQRVFRYVLRFVRDAPTAEEVVVDTMLAVWDGAKGCDRSSRVSTWVLGIARHKALDAVRRSVRQSSHQGRDDGAEVADSAEGPAEAASRRSATALTRRAIEQLSLDHREVLHLAFYEDASYEEIAQLLDVPQNTVKTRVFYAKKQLRVQLERLATREALP